MMQLDLFPAPTVQTLAELAATQRGALPISFGWTADRLPPHGCKSVTRRKWSDQRVKTMIGYCEDGRVLPAVNKSLCYGGHQIGWLLLQSVTREYLAAIDQDEVIKEGYPELTRNQFLERFFLNTSPRIVITRIEFTYEPQESA